MNLSLDYAVRYLQLNESLIDSLNYYVDNRLFQDGQNHINTLDIPLIKKEKLLNVFDSYSIPNQENYNGN